MTLSFNNDPALKALHVQQAEHHFAADMLRVDDDMLPVLDRYSWGLDSDGYPKAKVEGRHIRLHQHVMGAAPQRQVIDHVNRNKLDNRRCNLRFVSYRQNALNTSKIGDGVWFNRSKCRWQAQHKVNGRRFHIGTFLTQKAALTALAAWKNERDDLYAALDKCAA